MYSSKFKIAIYATVCACVFICSAQIFAQDNFDASKSDSTEDFLSAVFQNNVQYVDRILAAGMDVNATNSYRVSPLSLACELGHAEVVNTLIDAGAEVDWPRLGGETPLMLAARHGDVGVVQQLLVSGAEIDHRENKGQTALMWASAAGNVEVVDRLIRSGADINYHLDWAGFSAFHFAAREGKIDVVERFLEEGFDVNDIMNPKSTHGRNPRSQMSALLLAVESAHFELALKLVDAGADPNDQRSGYAPLHALSWVRRTKLGDNPLGDPAPRGSGNVTSLQFVDQIVQRGADVNLQLENGKARGKADLNSKGATPFLLASQTADLPLMKRLLHHDANPKITNADNCTALIATAGIGSVAVGEEPASEAEVCAAIELLVNLGLDVNAIDDNQETPMHGAAYRNYPKAVNLLAKLGAESKHWNHKNKFGWTPFDIGHGRRPGSLKPSPPTLDALEKALSK